MRDQPSPRPVSTLHAWALRWIQRRRSGRPRFSVSLEIADSPDFVCHLRVWNPGPEFVLRTCRLIVPRSGLIYRREQLLWEQAEGYAFNQIRLDARIRQGESADIPFELWLPRERFARRVRVGLKTSARLREYRCRLRAPAGTADRRPKPGAPSSDPRP